MNAIQRTIGAISAVATLYCFTLPAFGAEPAGPPRNVAAAPMALSNPILFVTQVPTLADFAARGSTFANHGSTPQEVARGGDLMIRYPNGTLRNLTQEAGFGMNGLQGANSIAVREPTVHWDGNKAVFSMLVGAPAVQYSQAEFYWQLYEVSGIGQGQTVSITKVPNQPANYNNVAPIYATDDRILFTSDRPFNGQAHLYPQLDEYESTATVSGIWSLNPTSGELKLLNHTPSGAFSPSIDSFGRVIFTRWDHLQRDQQADADNGSPTYGSFNYASEAPNAAELNTRAEVFPEPRADSTSPLHGPVNGHRFNQFTPWQMNEDGTDEETLNHLGRHEMSFGYLVKSFASDPKLSDYSIDSLHANTISVGMDTGLFHLREDPMQPGFYYATYTREFGTLSSGQILKISGAPSVNPESMTFVAETASVASGSSPGGRYRNPLPLATGGMLASHTLATTANPSLMNDFRLKSLTRNVGTGLLEASTPLTAGISKSVSWWDPDTLRTFSGPLWELEAVEVVARTRPVKPAAPLEAPESAVFTEEGVNETTFRNWLKDNNLALIVTRNHTSRDRGDKLQPFNLRVPGGVQTVVPGGGKIYDIANFQIFQGDLIRGYDRDGRRVIAQPLHASTAQNPANAGGPAGSVKIALDGSSAAIVPARRALAWQSTDATGEPVVRERVWVTFQPGEVRVCASCHGANTANQVGGPTPTNKPQALRDLLTFWKQTQAPAQALTVAKTGLGAGVVSGTGISCGADCNETYAMGTPVVLTATPNPGSQFASWTGCDSTSGNQCTVNMSAAKSVSAAFKLRDPALADFNADNKPDILWRNAAGTTYLWRMNGVSLISDQLVTTVDPSWKLDGIADFNGDGHPDIVWRNGAGDTYVWYLVNGVFQSDAFLFSLPPEWVIQGIADFNADGKPDFLMRNTNSGNAFVWFFNNNVATGDQFLFNIDPSWKVEGVADLNADGQPDLLFRNMSSGLAFAWNTQFAAGSLSLTTSSPPIFGIDPVWEIVQVADWNNDAKPDLLFRNKNTGVVFVWYLNGVTLTTSDYITQIDPSWEIVPRR